jgi:8-hydroxy-5-deazaflavin:NADPH oxidoreductase
MTHFSIIGTGNTGQAIACIVSKGGGTVELFGATDGAKPVTGAVVVLACRTRPCPTSSPSAVTS